MKMMKTAFRLSLPLAACMPILLMLGCSNPATDSQGRELPAIGQSARLIEPRGLLATSESALKELMTMPKIDLRAVSTDRARQMIDSALEKNAARLTQEGRVIQVSSGTKVRVLSYYHGDPGSIRPLTRKDRMALWVKVEIVEGAAKQTTGFTTADGVAE